MYKRTGFTESTGRGSGRMAFSERVFSTGYPENKAYADERDVLRALAYGYYPENFEKNSICSAALNGPFSAFRFCVLRTERTVTHPDSMQTELESVLRKLPVIEGGGCVISAFLDDRNFGILLCGETAALDENCAFLSKLRSVTGDLSIHDQRFFLAVGSCVSSPVLLYRSFGYIQACMRELFFLGWGRCAVRDAYRPMLPFRFDNHLITGFVQAFSRSDNQAVEHILESLYRDMVGQTDADPAEIRKIYYRLHYLMDIESAPRAGMGASGGENVTGASGLDGVLNAETLQALHSYTMDRVHRHMGVWTVDAEQSAAVHQVTRVMRTQYSDKNLSVKALAESVYLTPTYLSGLFKRQTGKTISRFLTEIRIEHAMKLLMDKKLKLYNVAEMVGYDDANYFSKIFKRYAGMTPSEFRERKII